jgi:hypothetical protein
MRTLVVAIAAAILAGCAISTKHTAPGTKMHFDLPPLPQAGGAATPPPASKEASGVLYDQTFPAFFTLLRSAGAVQDADSIVLSASGGDIEWAMYEAFNAASEGEVLDISLTVAGTQCWVLLADYDSGTWEFHGPYSGDPGPFDIDNEKYYSPDRRQYFAVLAWDGTQVTVENFVCTVESPSVIRHQISAIPVDHCSQLEVFDLNGVPAVAWISEPLGLLFFGFADNPLPANSGDWTWYDLAIVEGADYLSAAVIDGRPVIAFWGDIPASGQDMNLYYADSAAPADASHWQIAPVNPSGMFPDMCASGGRPVLSYWEEDPGDGDGDGALGYIRVSYPEGDDLGGTWEDYRAADADHLGSRPALAVLNGHLSVAFALLEEGRLYYGAASSLLPDGPGDWTLHSQPASAEPDSVELLNMDGYPLMRVAGFGSMYMYLASTTEPAGAGDWLSASFGPTPLGKGDMTVLNGRPAQPVYLGTDLYLARFHFLRPPDAYALPGLIDPDCPVAITAYSVAPVAGDLGMVWYNPDAGALSYARFAFD